MTTGSHPLFDQLRATARAAPLVVAHRGASGSHPENTLAAFLAARSLGVPMQEFDVRATRDGALVCVHDETFDRTSDAAMRLGPGALVAQMSLAEVLTLDAGAWKGGRHANERVPTLAAALAAMLPTCVPLIEHKAGDASAYVDSIARTNAMPRCILQSFDWEFLTMARRLAPGLAIAALGPNDRFTEPTAAALAAARALGAGMLHWEANALTRADVARIHADGMLVCTYTTDHELGWCGGARLGFDAMCTNEPERMLATARLGALQRSD